MFCTCIYIEIIIYVKFKPPILIFGDGHVNMFMPINFDLTYLKMEGGLLYLRNSAG